MRKFLPKTFSPAIQRYWERVPIGQIQPQKPFFSKTETATIATNMIKAAGWTGLMIPVNKKYLKDINPAIGRNASTEGGLCVKEMPWLSNCTT
jgi:hypothetical protein